MDWKGEGIVKEAIGSSWLKGTQKPAGSWCRQKLKENSRRSYARHGVVKTIPERENTMLGINAFKGRFLNTPRGARCTDITQADGGKNFRLPFGVVKSFVKIKRSVLSEGEREGVRRVRGGRGKMSPVESPSLRERFKTSTRIMTIIGGRGDHWGSSARQGTAGFNDSTGKNGRRGRENSMKVRASLR